MKKKVKPTTIHVYNKTFKQNYYLFTRGSMQDYYAYIYKQSCVLSENPDLDENIAGKTTITTATNQIFIFLRDSSDLYSLIHECVHAVQYTLKLRGIDDMETEAYMVEYLMRELWEKI